MHIPDGYLSDPVCMASATASTAALAWSVLRLRADDHRPPAAQMAVVGAGVFAVHMLNVPIDHGMSGHLVGAAVAAAVLGPWAATLTMTVVLALECFLFGDGGIGALGANVLNMAVVAPWCAAAILALDSRRRLSGGLPVWAAAGLVSTLLAVMACCLELGLSGTSSLAQLVPAMWQAHWLVGIAEGCITAAVVGLLGKRLVYDGRQDFNRQNFNRQGFGGTTEWIAGALVLALGILVAPWASALPDGLETVARQLGFADLLRSSAWSMAPDYALPGIEWQPLAVCLAAIVGMAAVFSATYGLGRLTAAGRVK